MPPKKVVNYSFTQYAEEAKRIDFQNNCPHKIWSTKCGICGKYLASDHHINCHTASSFKSDISVGLLVINSIEVNFRSLDSIYKLKEQYDELIVVTDSIQVLELYGFMRFIDKVELHSAEQEIAHLMKYREKYIQSITCLYPDTKSEEEAKEQFKNINIKTAIY